MRTATLPAALETARDYFGPVMATALDRLNPGIAEVAAYHLGLPGRDGRPPGAPGGGGKALRPALALLSAQAVGMAPEQAAPAAVAVELVHNFSLLHDDIMDGDIERRHRPTAWTVYGVGAAILAGDALLALAQDLLLEYLPSSARASRSLSSAVQRLIAGQAADLEFEKRDVVSVTECLDMAYGKTAALMACAASIGALYAGGPLATGKSLAGFGAHAGMAFQLTDDLLGIWGAPEVTGKPVRSDLQARKKSLPVVAALASGTDAGRDLGVLLAVPGPLTDAELLRAAELVEAAGGRQWAQDEVNDELTCAVACLAKACLPPDVRAQLEAIAEFLTGRQW